MFMLQGCAGPGSRRAPAPVTDALAKPRREPTPAPPPAPSEEVQVYAYRAPQASAFKTDSPVLLLVEQAGEQERQGNLDGAAASLERALRIEPRNAHLWNRLARVRLEQGSFAQAGDLAAKSDALAGDAPALRRDNRHIMELAGKARRQ